jgi:hypothetical protein
MTQGYRTARYPWWLFARSRGTAGTASALTVICIAGAALRHVVFTLPDASGFGVPWVTILPLLSACAIGISTRSPMNELEGTAARSLRGLRCAHAGTLVAIAAVLAVPVTVTLPAPASAPAALRNLMGLTGLALLCGRLLGGRLAWILPTVYTLAALTAGATGGVPHPWAWVLGPDHDEQSLAWAAAFAIAGAAALVQGPTREPAGETG